METNQNNNDQKSSFKTNVLPFLIIAGVLVVSTVVLYFVVQMIIN
jgi:sensor domain CHASE-containing protein